MTGQSAAPVGALPAGQSRDALLVEVRAALDATVERGADVVLAVSGGPDSTALAYLVTDARPDLCVCVAHVRHGLRDDAPDAAVAAAHAAALGVAYHEVAARVEPAGEGVEAAARHARYAALRRVARKVGAQAIAVGHSADDQAETVLLNIARGTGLRGLGGMAPARSEAPGSPVRLIRPLLRLRRDDVRAFVAGEGLRAVSDPTNRDPDQRRAQVREVLVPALAALSGGPGDPVAVLTRLADLARDDAEALEALAEEQAARLVVGWGPVLAVRTDDLLGLPRGLAGRVVRRWLSRVRGRPQGLHAGSVAAVLGLGPGQAVHVPGGVLVTAGGGWLAAAPPDTADLPARQVALPGVTALPEAGVALHAQAADDWLGAKGTQAALDLDAHGLADPRARRGRDARPDALVAAAPPGATQPLWAVLPRVAERGLVARARQPGDRLRTAVGRRKLADLLVDAGVPRAVRGLVPVVVDTRGEPLWVPGLALRHGPPGGAGPRLWLGPLA